MYSLPSITKASVCLTQKPPINLQTLYAIYALPEGEALPDTIEWTGNEPKGAMRLLKGNRKVKYACKNGKVIVTLPKGLENEPLAFSFKIK